VTCLLTLFNEQSFAAKEAAIKAHPHRRLTFHDVVVRQEKSLREDQGGNGSGPPVAVVKGLEGKTWDQLALLSISHDGDYATAVCMGFDAGSQGEVGKEGDANG